VSHAGDLRERAARVEDDPAPLLSHEVSVAHECDGRASPGARQYSGARARRGSLTCTCMHIRMRPVRTTIELRDEQRAELLRLAARRGRKGFSELIQEAVDAYLKQQGGREEAMRAALTLEGAFKGSAANRFEERVKAVRESWR